VIEIKIEIVAIVLIGRILIINNDDRVGHYRMAMWQKLQRLMLISSAKNP
jgi:hypothetical protein